MTAFSVFNRAQPHESELVAEEVGRGGATSLNGRNRNYRKKEVHFSPQHIHFLAFSAMNIHSR